MFVTLSYPTMPTLTSDRVNYLVWKYLQEEGLSLSAYAVNKESQIGNLDPEFRQSVREGELVRLLLRGLELSEIETQTLSSPREEHKSVEDDVEKGAPKANGLRLLGGARAGGIASVYSVESLVVVGSENIAVYGKNSNEDFLDCGERPTCVVPEPLGVIVGYSSGSVRQWRLDTHPFVLQSVLIPEIDVSLTPVLFLRRSPGGDKVAVVHKDGLICVWDLVERSMIRSYNTNTGHSGVADLAWLGSDLVFAVTQGDSISIYNLDFPDAPPSLLQKRADSKPVVVLTYDPILQLLAGGSDDGHVSVWSSASPLPLRELTAASVPAPITYVQFLGVHLLTGATDGSLRLFDPRQDKNEPVYSTNLSEPVFDIEVWRPDAGSNDQLAVITHNGVQCFVIVDGAFKNRGSVAFGDVQSVAGHKEELAITSTKGTYVVT